MEQLAERKLRKIVRKAINEISETKWNFVAIKAVDSKKEIDQLLVQLEKFATNNSCLMTDWDVEKKQLHSRQDEKFIIRMMFEGNEVDAAELREAIDSKFPNVQVRKLFNGDYRSSKF